MSKRVYLVRDKAGDIIFTYFEDIRKTDELLIADDADLVYPFVHKDVGIEHLKHLTLREIRDLFEDWIEQTRKHEAEYLRGEWRYENPRLENRR